MAKQIETREQDFLLKAYDILSSDAYRHYIIPLILDRIEELEERIIKDDSMDEQHRYGRKELIQIVALAGRVKQALTDGHKSID